MRGGQIGAGYLRLAEFAQAVEQQLAESKSTWDVFKITATIDADHAFRPLNEGGCPLVAK